MGFKLWPVVGVVERNLCEMLKLKVGRRRENLIFAAKNGGRE